MVSDFYLGEVIVESLRDSACLQAIEPFRIKTRARNMPDEKVPHWHIHRFRLPRELVLKIAPAIETNFAPGEWYVHFFSEQHDEMFVIMRDRTFRIPKHRDASWDEMIAYGESIGVGRRWTQSIPINLPD